MVYFLSQVILIYFMHLLIVQLLVGYVATTGNQTIAGVKTFTSSPIVPAPTTGTQAVNKQYVDNMVVISQNGSNSYAVAMAIVFGS
jgi:hypothetical protein